MPGQNVTPTNVLSAAGLLDDTLPITQLEFADGRVVLIPTALLLKSDQPSDVSDDLGPGESDEQSDSVTVPLIEEQLEVGKRLVVIGTVRLQKTVQEFETTLDEPLAVRTFDVERVILNQPVETAPGVRIEGDTTIYPLVEEQLILTKHLVLKEEVRITRRDTERRDTQIVVLRREHFAVEREPKETANVAPVEV